MYADTINKGHKAVMSTEAVKSTMGETIVDRKGGIRNRSFILKMAPSPAAEAAPMAAGAAGAASAASVMT